MRVSADEGSSQFEVDEATAQPRLFDLCNKLTREIARRRMADRKEARSRGKDQPSQP